MYIPPKGVDWWINYIYMLTPIVFSGQNRVLVIVLLKSFYYVWQNNINICRRSRVVRPPLEIRWRPSDANDRSMDAVVINYAYRDGSVSVSGNDVSTGFAGIVIRFTAFTQQQQKPLLQLSRSFVVTTASILALLNALEPRCCVVTSAPFLIFNRKEHVLRAISALYTHWPLGDNF